MIYKNGYTSNSYELTRIIHAAMRNAGWDLVSGNSPDGIDSVFYSKGEDGYQDIYVRIAAGLKDIVSHGNIQFPFSDGYTEYVNFFAYQYYPNNSTPDQGVNEIGRFGPALFVNDTSSEVRMHSLYSNSNSYFTRFPSPYAYFNWSRYSREITDGGRYLFYNMYVNATSNYQYLGRFDTAYPIGLPIYAAIHGTPIFTNVGYGQRSVYSRRGPAEKLIWVLPAGAISNYNTDTSVITTGGASWQPPWGTGNSNYGWMVQGVRRNKKRYIYAGRGENAGEWARWDMDDQTWSVMSPNSGSVWNGSYAIYIMKEITGYAHDRIYVAAGSPGGLYSIAIDDDGNPTGSWTSHAGGMPFSFGYNSYSAVVLICPGGNKLIATYAGTSSAWEWTFPVSPTGSSTWASTSISGLASSVDATYSRVSAFTLQHHLLSKVRVEEGSLTQYWILINKNRVIALTKSAESATACGLAYAGYFIPYANSPARVTGVIDSKNYIVDDTSKFKIGASYKMLKIRGGTDFITNYGKTVKRNLGEMVSIAAVNYSNSQVTLSSVPSQTYTVGTLIGEEVQPVGVFLSGKDEVQTLDRVNTVTGYINDNPVFQTYKLGVPYDFYPTTTNERIGGVTTWPVVLTQTEMGNYGPGEVRGELDGVKYGASSFPNGSSFTIDGKKYLKFSIYNSYRLGTIFIGPVE